MSSFRIRFFHTANSLSLVSCVHCIFYQKNEMHVCDESLLLINRSISPKQVSTKQVLRSDTKGIISRISIVRIRGYSGCWYSTIQTRHVDWLKLMVAFELSKKPVFLWLPLRQMRPGQTPLFWQTFAHSSLFYRGFYAERYFSKCNACWLFLSQNVRADSSLFTLLQTKKGVRRNRTPKIELRSL